MDSHQYHGRYYVWPTHESHAATGTSDEASMTLPVQRVEQPASVLPIYTEPSSSTLPLPSLPQHNHQHQPRPLLLYQYPECSEYPEYQGLQNQSLGPVDSTGYNVQRTPPPDYHNRNHHPAASTASTTGTTSSRGHSHNLSHNLSHTDDIPARSQLTAYSTRLPFNHLPTQLLESNLVSHMAMAKQTASPALAASSSAECPSGCPSDSTTAVAGQEGHLPVQVPIQVQGVLAANDGSSGEPHMTSPGFPDQNQGQNAYMHLHTGFTSSALPLSRPLPTPSFAGPALSQASLQNLVAVGPTVFLPPSPAAIPGGHGHGHSHSHDISNAYAYCLDRGNGIFTRLIPADLLPPFPGLERLQRGCQGMIVLRDLPMTAPPAPPQATAVPAVPRYVPPMRSAQPPGGRGSHGGRGGQRPRRDKIYCDKWIHNGECAFAQQGCKFRHEMPHEVSLQQALGLFNGYPAWYPKAVAQGVVPIDMDNVPPQLLEDIRALEPQYVQQFELRRSGAEPWRQRGSWRKRSKSRNDSGDDGSAAVLERMTSSMNLGEAPQLVQQPARMFSRRPADLYAVGYPPTGRPMRGPVLAPGAAGTDFGPIAPPASASSATTAPLSSMATGAEYSLEDERVNAE